MAKWFTPQTLDPEVQGARLTHQLVSLHKKLYSTNKSLFTQVNKWVLAIYCCRVTKQWTSIPSGGE